GRDHAPPDRPGGFGVLGRDDEEARRDRLALADFAATLGHVSRREPVEDRAIGLATGQAQHARAQRAEQDRRTVYDRPREFEAVDLEGLEYLVDLLAVQGPLDEVEDV